MNIRVENEADIKAIFEITEEAFKDCQHSQSTEPFIINALRKDNALTISLVAELDGNIAGHVAFSPVTISDGSCEWYTLGPVSVKPKLQRQGIGQALVHEGLSQLKTLGAQGCILVGDPAYYTRFGFKNFRDLSMEGVPPAYLLGLSFAEKEATGVITIHHAFFVKKEES